MNNERFDFTIEAGKTERHYWMDLWRYRELFYILAWRDNLTVELLATNDYQLKTRNKLIAMMFKECGSIEKYGTGISRIKKQCARQGLRKPRFEELHKGFKVTLPNKTTQETTQEPGRPHSTQEKMLALIKQNGSITRAELAVQIGVSEDAIKQQLAKLKKPADYRGSVVPRPGTGK